MTALRQEQLLDSSTLRNQYIERTEVLAKVKELFLIPGAEMLSTKHVAEYYEVDMQAIRKIIARHSDELISDGMKKMTATVLKGHCVTSDANPCNYPFTVTLPNGQVFQPNNGPVIYFPLRAILRIGMLLRDSTIAKEVRTQLLNTFETTTESQRTEAIDQEDRLLLAVLHAKDTVSSVEALAEYKRFMDRHVAKLEAKVTDLESQLDLVARGTLTWGSRPVANALVCALAGASHAPIPYTWGRVFRQLYYALGIRLDTRKPASASKIARIRDDEWSSVLKVIASLAYEAGVDIPKCLNTINAEHLTSS